MNRFILLTIFLPVFAPLALTCAQDATSKLDAPNDEAAIKKAVTEHWLGVADKLAKDYIFSPASATDKPFTLHDKAVFRYSSKSGLIADGALFGLSATGTNPDAIVAIQWREEGDIGHWEFACMGTTNAGLKIRMEETEVWSQPILVGQGPVFETWTWFFSGRTQ
jgi:hypothetical protein